MIDCPLVWSESARDGLIAFGDLAFFESPFHFGQGDLIVCEKQYARGGLVESVNWRNATANLIAKQFNGESSFFGVDSASMHKQARRLVDRYVVVVLVQDWEKFGVGCVQLKSKSPAYAQGECVLTCRLVALFVPKQPPTAIITWGFVSFVEVSF